MTRLKQVDSSIENVDPGYWFFKLFNSIKEEHEVDFAELELVSLLGPVERVRNFADVLHSTPLKHFTSDPIRIQDILGYEPCYGHFQGFMAKSEAIPDLEKLSRRLAYTREIIGVIENPNPKQLLGKYLLGREPGIGTAFYLAKGYSLLRLVTNQYYLEKSAYVSKLSRNEEEIRKNVKTLLEYPFQQFYRIPASATMSVGKRLEDYFTIREESSLYLTHMLHPYKGKFHAKMVRALLNYVMPIDSGQAMDNFAGSGTLLLEASLMGLTSIGVEINPLSVLMSNVKSQALVIEPESLNKGISLLLTEVSDALSEYQTVNGGDTLLVHPRLNVREVTNRSARVPESVKEGFSSRDVIEKHVIAHHILTNLSLDENVRAFLLLGLSGTISDLSRRTSRDFVEVLATRLAWMYRRVYLFSELNRHLGITLGKGTAYVGDTRDMGLCWTLGGKSVPIPDSSIDAIVNSPPYSTALDYIRNDLPQLTILGLTKSLEQLERNMVGNPNLRSYSPELTDEIGNNTVEFSRLPDDAKTVVRKLITQGRPREALRVYRFFKDMHRALLAMKRVLKPRGKAAIIIGNNNYKLDGDYVEVKNDEVIAEIAKDIGMSRDKRLPFPRQKLNDETGLSDIPGGIRRRLEKTMTGMIRYETVLVLEKPP